MAESAPERKHDSPPIVWLRRFVYAVVGIIVAMNLVMFLFVPAQGVPRSVDDARLAYMSEEGHARRGRLFQQLVQMLAVDTRMADARRALSVSEIMEVLGPPDMVKRGGARQSFVYYYDRYGTKDWAVLFETGHDGTVMLGFGSRSWIDLTGWQQYEPSEREEVRGHNTSTDKMEK